MKEENIAGESPELVITKKERQILDSASYLFSALDRIAYGLSQDGRTHDGMTKAEAVAIARKALAKAEGHV